MPVEAVYFFSSHFKVSFFLVGTVELIEMLFPRSVSLMFFLNANECTHFAGLGIFTLSLVPCLETSMAIRM